MLVCFRLLICASHDLGHNGYTVSAFTRDTTRLPISVDLARSPAPGRPYLVCTSTLCILHGYKSSWQRSRARIEEV